MSETKKKKENSQAKKKKEHSETKKKKEHSETTFQEDWLSKEQFKLWLRKVEKDPKKAYCTLYETTFKISNGGSSAIVSHQKGRGHNDLVTAKSQNRIGNYFNTKRTNSNQASSSSSASSNTEEVQIVEKPLPAPSTLPYVSSDDILEAEIVWCLYLVQCHHSYRSCDPVPSVLNRMFSSCQLIKKFQMKKDKARYLIVYGIYPALLQSLQKKINASPWHTVSFDESLNRDQQQCQMDVNIRYWSTEENQVKTSYYDSR